MKKVMCILACVWACAFATVNDVIAVEPNIYIAMNSDDDKIVTRGSQDFQACWLSFYYDDLEQNYIIDNLQLVQKCSDSSSLDDIFNIRFWTNNDWPTYQMNNGSNVFNPPELKESGPYPGSTVRKFVFDRPLILPKYDPNQPKNLVNRKDIRMFESAKTTASFQMIHRWSLSVDAVITARGAQDGKLIKIKINDYCLESCRVTVKYFAIAMDQSYAPEWNPQRQLIAGKIKQPVALFKATNGLSEDVFLQKIVIKDEIRGIDTFSTITLYSYPENLLAQMGINSRSISPNKEMQYDIFVGQKIGPLGSHDFMLWADIALIKDPVGEIEESIHRIKVISATFVGMSSGEICTIYPEDCDGGDFGVTGDITTSVTYGSPSAFSASSHPNPFNPSTTISFSLAKAGETVVEVYNISGQKVATLVNGFKSAGQHSIVWNAKNLSAGIYFCIVRQGDQTKKLKMTLVK